MHVVLAEEGAQLPMTETGIALLALTIGITVAWLWYLYQ